MSLSLSLLGTFEVRRDGRPLTDFRAQSVRALLAYLALGADRPHEREHLCEMLWPNAPLPVALTNLRQALHRLRKVIEPAGEAGRYLIITRQSVQLSGAGLQLEAAHFEELAAAVAAHQHRSPAGCAPCVALMRQALSLYRGDLLPGFGYPESELFEEWLQHQRERLRATLFGLLDGLSAYHERRGEAGPALELLRRWVELDPWNEGAWLRLVSALAQSDQRALALRQFERYRAALGADLGIEPGPAITELVARVRVGAVNRRSIARVQPEITPVSPLVGRGHELELVGTLLSQPGYRLITLLGMGGSGKTRLALAAAEAFCFAFADGVLFVELASLSQASQVLEAIGGTLEQRATPGRPRLEQVTAALRERELLLVLETCEQINGLGVLLSRLLAAAPGLTVLATSRAALELRAETIVPVEGLGLAALGVEAPDPESYPAGRLFAQVARRVCPGFAPKPAEARLVLECCALLAGNPLAIELAAGQLRARSLVALADAMRGGLRNLATALSDVPPRHQSLRAVFDWSWQLLDDDERRSLARLALCVGGFDRAAALAISGEAVPLDRLVAKSLVQRCATGRYLIHEQTRQFAEEQLMAWGEAEQARAMHGSYFLRLAASQATQAEGPHSNASAGALEVESDNLRLAWEWAAHTGEDGLCIAVARVLRQLGILGEPGGRALELGAEAEATAAEPDTLGPAPPRPRRGYRPTSRRLLVWTAPIPPDRCT